MRYFALVAFLCGCTRAAPPPEPVAAAPAVPEERPVPQELAAWSWSTISVGTGVVAEVRQVPSAKGVCRVTASLGSQKVWSVPTCLGMSEDRRFVSADAAALVVLKGRLESEHADLGAIYRKGDRVAVLTAASLHLPRSAIHGDGYAATWVAPREARETATGVEVELLDGSLLVMGFDGKSAVTPGALSSAAITAIPPEDCGPCSYTDAEGVYHFVQTSAEVPERYQGVARRVRGGVRREENVVIVRSTPQASDPSVASPRAFDPTVARGWVDEKDRAEDAEAARYINAYKNSPNVVHDTVTDHVENIVTDRVEHSVKPME